MRKYISFLISVIMLVSLCGCTARKSSTEKIKDLEFTVLKEEEIPKELKVVIDERKSEVMKEVYTDGNWIYIAEGYGEKKESGYSVEVDACYETANAIYVHTNLLGPSKEETVVKTTVYPYVVVKLEYIDKHIVFE